MEPDIFRYQRYRRPFSLAVIETALPPALDDDRLRSAVVAYAANFIRENLRVIDTLGVLDEEGQVLAAILAETDRRSSKQALHRLTKLLFRGVGSCFDVAPVLYTGLANYNGQDAGALIEAARAAVK
jgi:hypothetical protein